MLAALLTTPTPGRSGQFLHTSVSSRVPERYDSSVFFRSNVFIDPGDPELLRRFPDASTRYASIRQEASAAYSSIRIADDLPRGRFLEAATQYLAIRQEASTPYRPSILIPDDMPRGAFLPVADPRPPWREANRTWGIVPSS